MAKLVQVSSDSGVTWKTLPGSSGSFSSDADQIDDTVFGQTYSSMEVGLVGWSVAANAVYKGYAGYKLTLKKQGSSTTFTDEQMALVSGKTYKISDSTKNVWDRSQQNNFVVYDDSADVTAQVLSWNWLFGEITFLASYSVVGNITVDGNYFPLQTMGKAQSVTLTQSMDAIDNTDFPTAQGNDGHRTFTNGLRTVELQVDNVYALSSGFLAALDGRAEWLVEINPDGWGRSKARGFFHVTSHEQSGDVGDLEVESITFSLAVPPPDTDTTVPFDWRHESDSPIPDAVKICLDAFTGETAIDVRYLHNGTNGVSGDCVVTDISLSATLDGMNEFSVTLQGSGDITVI